MEGTLLLLSAKYAELIFSPDGKEAWAVTGSTRDAGPREVRQPQAARPAFIKSSKTQPG